MLEIWKYIDGSKELYMVSDQGRIKSLVNKRIIMKQSIDSTGYLVLNLVLHGKKITRRVHQLVAIAFLGHVPDGYNIVVDHKKNNKLDNRASELQLLTHRENVSKDRKGCSSKYPGVCWNKKNKKWFVSIQVGSKRKYLGLFHDELLAHITYENYKKTLK